jgi:hypothetical protein
MNDEPKQKFKLPKNHELKLSWHREGSNMTDLLSIITYYAIEKRYYLWKVYDDGKLEKIKTKQSPDFSISEMNE